VKNFSFFLLTFVLLAACNSRTVKKSSGASAEADSVATLPASIVDLSSATSINELLCQNWENKDDAETAQNNDGSGNLEMPYRSFVFFSDSTVVKNPREKMQYGHWVFNDDNKTIAIKYEDGETEKYTINAIGARDLTLTKSGADNTKLIFVADGKQEKDYKDNPFYYTNNYWRIKPKTAETDAAIKERLQGNIHFYWLFLNDNINRNSGTISFYGLPSCFNWYSGGIGIMNENELKANWINTFYNKEQAMKARAIMENLILKKYSWDSTQRNWLKQSAPILLQMRDSLK